MAKKTMPETDYSTLYGYVKRYAEQQVTTQQKKWHQKTALEAWLHLVLCLEFWEQCPIPPDILAGMVPPLQLKNTESSESVKADEGTKKFRRKEK